MMKCDTCGGIGECLDVKCYGGEPKLEMTICPDCMEGLRRDYYNLLLFLDRLGACGDVYERLG